jgi:hypothetical protein
MPISNRILSYLSRCWRRGAIIEDITAVSWTRTPIMITLKDERCKVEEAYRMAT